jgi:hypothetical protein
MPAFEIPDVWFENADDSRQENDRKKSRHIRPRVLI